MSVVEHVPGTNIDWARMLRLGQYGLVGASGIPVDMAVVWVAFSVVGSHYLVAQVAAFAVAVTWNFALNYHWTFNAPDGSLPRQYLGYVGIQSAALGARVGIVFVLVDIFSAPVLPASLGGIIVPSVLGYLASERVFGVIGDG